MGTKKREPVGFLPQDAESPVPAQRITQADGESTLSGVLEAALEIAKRCPHLEHGTIDVAEAMEMGM